MTSRANPRRTLEVAYPFRKRAALGAIEGDYRLADITPDPPPRCDAILCRDCLVHLCSVELINENCLEGGGGWRDKSLGVWRL